MSAVPSIIDSIYQNTLVESTGELDLWEHWLTSCRVFTALHWTLLYFTLHGTLLLCTLNSAHCTVYTVQCTLYSAHCTVYTAQCTLQYRIERFPNSGQ